jgi:flagellar assembly protein FliH
MEPLNRSVRLDPLRTRLSEVRSGRSQLEVLTGEIESRLRAELAAHAQEQYETAHAQGLADGRAAAIAEAKKGASEELRRTIGTLAENAHAAINALEKAHRAALQKLEVSVGEVAFASVCHLVGQQAASRSFVASIVERTCAQLRADINVTARLHPRDIDILRELLQQQELRVGSLGVRVVPDESLELGGCVIEAASGQYDAGLESQLLRLHAILSGAPPEPAMTG